jgi:hypothetical protein
MLRVFENRVLRRIFGPKKNEVTGGWRKLHFEELHNLCSLPTYKDAQVEEDGMGWAYSAHGAIINAYKIWLESLEGRDNLEDLGVSGRMILQWILRELGLEGADWIHLAQDRTCGGLL